MKTNTKVQLEDFQLCTLEDLKIGGSDVLTNCEQFEARIFGKGNPFNKSGAKTVQIEDVVTGQRFRIKVSSMLNAALVEPVPCITRNTDTNTVDFDKTITFLFEAKDWIYTVTSSTGQWEVPANWIDQDKYDNYAASTKNTYEAVDGKDGVTYYVKKAKKTT